MSRWIALLIFIAAASACHDSPTSPSDAVSLRVQVVDDLTREPIIDPGYRLELHLAGESDSYTQPVVNGAARFQAVAQGEYQLATTALFGYLQLDIVNITIDQAQSITLWLAPIDDLGVEQISVDGQGVIPMGGTIAIPVRGVTLRLRGKYQSPTSPWPARNEFSVVVPSLNPDADGFGHEGGRMEGGPSSRNEFELCSRVSWPSHAARGAPVVQPRQRQILFHCRPVRRAMRQLRQMLRASRLPSSKLSDPTERASPPTS